MELKEKSISFSVHLTINRGWFRGYDETMEVFSDDYELFKNFVFAFKDSRYYIEMSYKAWCEVYYNGRVIMNESWVFEDIFDPSLRVEIDFRRR